MPRRTAGNDVNTVELQQLLGGQRHALQRNVAVVVQIVGNGFFDRGGLLHDLFEHEVVVAAFFRAGNIPGDDHFGTVHRMPVGIENFHAVFGQPDHLVILQRQHAAGIRQHRGNIRSDEIAEICQSHDQRAGVAHCDQLVGMIVAQNAQRVGALQTGNGFVHRVHQIAGVVLAHQMRHHFGVGFGQKLHAFVLQLLPQHGEVLDNAVVYHSNFAVGAAMGVGVDVAGLAVGCPAGVPNADGRVNVDAVMHHFLQLRQASLGFLNFDASVFDIRNAGRVIAAIFQLGQSVQQQRRCRLCADESNDSAHMCHPFCVAAGGVVGYTGFPYLPISIIPTALYDLWNVTQYSVFRPEKQVTIQ